MAEADTTRRELTQVTAASAVIFGMLMASYVLVVWLLGALQAVESSGQTWWIALVVALALGAAAGLGFSYQVLRLLGAGDILRRMGRISAEAVARWLPEETGVSADSDVETVHRARAEGDQDLIPVVSEEGKYVGTITPRLMLEALQGQTMRR